MGWKLASRVLGGLLLSICLR